jgi:hypothetical protein
MPRTVLHEEAVNCDTSSSLESPPETGLRDVARYEEGDITASAAYAAETFIKESGRRLSLGGGVLILSATTLLDSVAPLACGAGRNARIPRNSIGGNRSVTLADLCPAKMPLLGRLEALGRS